MRAPIPGSRPHAPLATRDGAILYTGQMTNRLGRVDPKTGQLQQSNMIGRLDPETGKVTEWQSPGGLKSEPYGIVFAKGAVWYSESGTRPNTIVRFDPKTETFQTWVIPSGGYIVRKMDVTPDGNPVIATSTVNGVGIVEVK